MLSVVSVIKGMRGGSQSRLVLCDDGDLYVLKMHPNPQGPNVLANEALGAILMRGLGLKVPGCNKVTINLKTLPLFRELTMETMEGTTVPAFGVHFASRYVGGAGIDVFDFIPESHVFKVKNFEQFAAAYLFDRWANHQDQRQCVYRRRKGGGAYEALFIDNGHLFGGPDWSEVGAKFRDGSLVGGFKNVFDAVGIERWTTLLETRIPRLLDRAVKEIPQEWYQGDINAQCTRLIGRLGIIRAIVEDGSREHTKV